MKAPRFRCWKCGETFVAYAAAERHGDTPGHGRIETAADVHTAGGAMSAPMNEDYGSVAYWRGRAEMAEAAYLTGKPVAIDVADLIHLLDDAVALLDGVVRVPWEGKEAADWWAAKREFRGRVLAHGERMKAAHSEQGNA